MLVPDGFPGQRLISLPRPLVRAALRDPGMAHLVVTDCGYFPRARAHGMSREAGVDEAIILMCTQGAGWVETSGHRHEVGKGQIIVLLPGAPHSYGANETDPWTLWWVHIAGPGVKDLLRSNGASELEPVREVQDPFRVVGLVEEIVRHMRRDATKTSLLEASGAAWHLLTVIAAASTNTRDSTSMLDRARDYLRDHVEERVSVSDLAALANLSPSHFAALFRRRFGIAVLKYQTQLRMARARELLDTTDLAVSRIAVLVGYQDPFYFSRHFRSIHGITARAYRAHRKG